MVTKIQLAAMSRANISRIEDRRPFQLYVDEFQNFATDSFAVILSEARKYGLNLTIANQYISQMPQEVRDAVFGNVGTIISFRVSADDAPYLAKYFAPTFEGEDLIKLNNRHFIISMSIDGEKAPAFSARSLNVPGVEQDYIPQIIEQTRQRYSSSRPEVEAEISSWAQPKATAKPNNKAHTPKQAPNRQRQNHQGKPAQSHQPKQSAKSAASHRSKPQQPAKAAPAAKRNPDGSIGHGEVVRLRNKH